MKIAVTYDNGEIYQHFGSCGAFKVYEVEDGQIVSSEVIDSNGQGHGALAGMLSEKNIDVLICGGIGGGAQTALKGYGIEICAGVHGNADGAVGAFIRGELTDAGVTCDHHHHEDGGGCGSSCGSGCGSSCGSGAPVPPPIEGKNVGRQVKVHYKGTLNDGSQFDSSYDRGEPLEFVCGAGMMIRGFDAAVATMDLGEVRDIHLMPEEAYGNNDPGLIFEFKISDMPGTEGLEVGQRVALYNQMGQPIPVTVIAKDDVNITFDANHEMAGKELNFKIELVEIL